MCTIMKEIKEEGRAEGRAEGLKQALCNCIWKVSISDACKYLQCTHKDFMELLEQFTN